MFDPYHVLPTRPLGPGTRVARITRENEGALDLDSPALEAMTDLRRVRAASTHPGLFIDDAMEQMIRDGVRMLFVTDREGRLLGLVTATDIMGEKPLAQAARRRVPRGEIRVADIMTPLAELEAFSLPDLRVVHIGDVIATLHEAGRQHAIVLEDEDKGNGDDAAQVSTTVRGLFSASHIGALLGVEVAPSGHGHTFAELETRLLEH